MRAIETLDQEQLRRINDAIANIQNRTPADRRKAGCLLDALIGEREEILRYHSKTMRRQFEQPLAA